MENNAKVSALGFFLKSVGYPEQAPVGVASHVLRVDGMEIRVVEDNRRILLSYVLTNDDSLLATLAGYAAGRMLKEDAALSWEDGYAFLWQEAPVNSDAAEFRRLFESFLDSCDWWRFRVDELRSGGSSDSGDAEMMMIRP